MVMFSSQISQQMFMQQMLMSQQMQQAQLLSQQMGLMPTMPVMPQMNIASALSHMGSGGVYGEQIAGRMVGGAQLMGTMGSLGMGLLGARMGVPMDPFSALWIGGRAGFASAGIGGAALGAVGLAAPFVAANQLIGAYTGAFTGGMRDQAGTNAMLRQNFQFLGGQGTLGRGFSQMQMGQIGNMLQTETQRMPFTSNAELNQLIQGGQEAGLFRAVRDVESFGRRFRTMLEGLRRIQNELGGTLADALNFTRGSQQLGIFTPGGQRQFAVEMRDTMSTTGMNQNELFSIAATGSMLSRAAGGFGRQGAVGALRTARTLGAALSTGVINQEALSEATGGLQGDEAIQAFTARTLQQSLRHSRTPAGRYFLFAAANQQGTGLDQGMLDRLRMGDVTTGEIMRTAHGNVNRMGRARALNREGILRGAAMEEGGLSLQIAEMRARIGERALAGGDDLAQLYMQRRMGLSQGEAQLWTGLMRNQGTIAQREDIDRMLGRRDVAERRDIAMNRSVDAFLAQFSHGIQEGMGIMAARRMGRNFLTQVSDTVERAMNTFLGVAPGGMNMQDRHAMARLTLGRATNEDLGRLRLTRGTGATGAGLDYFARPMANEMLRHLGAHPAATEGEMMVARDPAFLTATSEQRAAMVRSRDLARVGVLQDAGARAQLEKLRTDPNTASRFALARMSGGATGVYQEFRGMASADVLEAYAAQQGIELGDTNYLRAMAGQGRTQANTPGLDELQMRLSGGIGANLGGAADLFQSLAGQTDADRAVGFVARGGHAGRIAREVLAAGRGNQSMSLREAEHISRALQDAPDTQTVRQVLESDDYKMAMRRVLELPANQREQELSRMSLEAQKRPGDQAKAWTLALTQLRVNMRTMGMPGAELRMGSGLTRAEQELVQEYQRASGQWAGIVEAVGGRDTRLGSRAQQVVGALAGFDPDTARAWQGELEEHLARLDPGSEEYNRLAEQIGTANEAGRGVMGNVAARRGIVREVTGRGRQGRGGAAHAILGQVTGGLIGNMEFTLGGRGLPRAQQARRIYEEFRRGGANADALAAQLTTQMRERGIENADAHVAEIRGMVQSGRGMDEQEGHAFVTQVQQNASIRKAREAGMMAQQRATDVLGAERNDLLKSILNGINTMANQDPEKKQSIDTAQGGKG